MTALIIEILVGLLCGAGGVMIKAYIPQLNPLQKSLLNVLDSIPVKNEAIVEIAEGLAEKGAAKFLAKKLPQRSER